MTYMDIYAYFKNTHNIIILCAFKCKLFNLVFMFKGLRINMQYFISPKIILKNNQRLKPWELILQQMIWWVNNLK
jgi:hypothetical protein